MDKIQYELSLWEYQLIDDVYKEQYILNIGTSSSNEKNQAFNLQLTENINGSVSLSFSVYQKYFDQDVNDFVENPFLGLLVNERLLKLKLINSFYDVNIEHEDSDVDTENEWYDLIIKNIEENSSNNIFTYTAVGAQINELSKNGFSLEFNSELENNSGTIIELAEKALEETDWSVDIDNSDTIRQYTQEPLKTMQVKPGKTITAVNALNNTETITLEENDIILGFYSCINNQEPDLQFLYKENGIYTTEENVIINSKNYIISNNNYTNFIYTENVYESQGKKLISKQKSIFDPVLDRTVLLYTNSNNDNIRGYTETEYITPTVIQNLITNNKNFITTDGWYFNTNVSILPKYNTSTNKTFLQIKSSVAQTFFYNNGIEVTRSYINGFSIGEKYRIRINSNTTPNIFPNICKYSLENGVYSLITNYFSFGTSWIKEADTDYYYLDGSCIKSISYASLITEKIGVLFKQNNTNALNIYDIQLFKKETDANGSVLNPDSIWTSTTKTLYNYYKYDSTISTLDDIVYLYKGEEQQSYSPVFTENYEKIRSIEISESNRFNILQSLSEIFECWMKIDVKHNYKGDILSKKISFKEFIGEENYAGFKYGLNLKSITRNLISNQIVTKIVVKNNANSFAENGFCSIARADENPTKENFLLNFDYYINQGFLNRNQIINDLYLTNGNFLGYYAHLKENNLLRDKYIDEQTALATEYTNINAVLQAFEIAKEEANVQLNTLKNELKLYNGLINYKNYTGNDDKVIEYIQAITATEQNINNFSDLVDSSSTNLATVKTKQEEITDNLNTILENNSILHSAFYEKYGKFIQEGSWISEDYIDDNLYYLDADSTLRTSAMPQVNYTINVTDISAIDEYKNYSFKCGNKTYVEDTEFFGWNYINGVKTPYKEEVIISQIVRVLDNPINNKITVQNYKTQFEDLFQRITATTQAVQYHSGAYNKVSDIIEEDGTIKSYTLQNSFLNNSIILENSNDQSVIWNDSGITAIDKTDLSKMLRLVGGGVFLSKDGGQTWSAGITGNGVNANYITAGQIDTQKINIMDGNNTSFRWDSTGINAYFSNDLGTDYNKFVRYDKFGIYGVQGEDSDIFKPNSVDAVKEKALFAFLWDNFFIKSSKDDGHISISSENDFQVVDQNNQERIKIGRLTKDASGQAISYGLRISDNTQTVVMQTNDDGQLFLQDKLFFGSNNGANKKVIIGPNGTNDDGAVKVFEVNGVDETDSSTDDNLIVMYDDGKFIANNVEIKGNIQATSGKIGNLTIEGFEETVKTLRIVSDKGTTFKVNNNISSPAFLTLTAETQNINVSAYSWKGSSDFSNWSNLTGTNDEKNYQLNYSSSLFSSSDTYYIKVVITEDNTETRESFFTVTKLIDGQNGSDGVDGQDGSNGVDGEDGVSLYTWIKYATSITGENMSDDSTDKSYIGLAYNKSTPSESNLASDYTWSLIKGSDEQYFINSSVDTLIKFKAENGNLEFNTTQINLSLEQNLSSVSTIVDVDDYAISLSFLCTSSWNGELNLSDTLNAAVVKKARDFVTGGVTELNEEDYIINLSPIINGSFLSSDNNNNLIIQQALLNKDCILKIKMEYKNNFYILPIESRFGFSQEMIDFSINAASINASIGEGGLLFNSSGLTISNGNFTLTTTVGGEEVKSIYFDEETGNAIFNGSGTFGGSLSAATGTFSGALNAATGSFSGSLSGASGDFTGQITANEGFIGGIEIRDQGLHSENFDIYNTGKIVANDLEIGSALLTDKIVISDEVIINKPTSSTGQFLKAGDIRLFSDGKAAFGSILIDGTSSVISAENNGTLSWELTPNRTYLNNAFVNGTLSAAVFDVQTVTGSGGITVFKDSYKIQKIENTSTNNVYKIFFDQGIDISNIDIDEYLILKGSVNVSDLLVKCIANNKDVDNSISVNSSSTPSNVTIVVNIGKINDDNTGKEWIIGINSTDASTTMGLRPKAISLNSFSLSDGQIYYSPEITIGQLSGNRGSGLEATNVFLEGTLSTSFQDGGDIKTAGVNTMSTTEFNKDPGDQDNSPIIFWGGADNNESLSIQNAPFQVTSSGFLYASKGYFTGSIITDSIIEAAEIKTAIITGSSSSLTLRGSSIVFQNTNSTGSYENALTINNKQINFLGKSSTDTSYVFSTKDNNGKALMWIKANGETFSNKFTTKNNQIEIEDSSIYGANLSISANNKIDLSIKTTEGSSEQFASFSPTATILNQNLSITPNNYGGYDFNIV